MVTVFKQNQRLRVNGKEYRVAGMVAYAQENWRWKEYTLRGTSGGQAWLYVETDQGETEYTLYTKCRFQGNMNDISINYNGRIYNRYESGIASVTGFFGPEDVDVNERVRFSDFRNEESETYLSIEDWEGEREYTFGEELDPEQIVVLDQGSSNSQSFYAGGSYNGARKKKKFPSVAVWLLIFVAVVGGITWIGTTSTPIQDYLKSDSSYQYVTSITNNQNNKKARVYASDLSVDYVVNDIIDAIPNKIKSVVEATDEYDFASNTEGVGLLSSNEYAFVYTAENGQTYIQVSGKKFMDGQSDAYHSSSRSGYYYHTYRRKRSHILYASALSSARQSSTSSRSSSGGGTSSGK